MKEIDFRPSEFQHHNDDESVKISRTANVEKTKLSLRHIRKIHRIKSNGLGHCYSALGDTAWQILCEIHLHNIEENKIDITKIKQSVSLNHPIAVRYLKILQTKKLVKTNTVNGQESYQDLYLTEFGQIKVQDILEERAEAFTSIFIYSRPQLAIPD
ncbi:MAG: hypothetical protein Pars2KO_27890 [Parasphingorhabdus sp.]